MSDPVRLALALAARYRPHYDEGGGVDRYGMPTGGNMAWRPPTDQFAVTPGQQIAAAVPSAALNLAQGLAQPFVDSYRATDNAVHGRAYDPMAMVDLGGAISGGGLLGAGDDAALGMGIRAYHGSPHSFDRFSTSAIGTGEGAQAYGHGLYFAENEGVARAYRDMLSPEPSSVLHIDGKPFDFDGASMNEKSAYRLMDIVGDGSVMDHGEALKEMARAPSVYEQGVRDQVDAWKDAKFDWVHTPGGGHMYEVGINADPAHFLDWDKPLSGQPAIVQQAIKSHPQFEAYQGYLNSSTPVGDLMKRGLLPDSFEPSSRQAVQYMADAGVPGIRYLDRGSRGTGKGTNNYVVFDDSLVDIARKYGLAGAGLGGAALAGTVGSKLYQQPDGTVTDADGVPQLARGGGVRPRFEDGGDVGGDGDGYGGGFSMYGGYGGGSSASAPSSYGGSTANFGGGSSYGGWSGGGSGASSFGLGGISSGQATGLGGSSISSSGNSGWGGSSSSVGGSYSSRGSDTGSATASNGWGGGSTYGGYSNGSGGFGLGGGSLSGYGGSGGGNTSGYGSTGLGGIGTGAATSIGSGGLGSGFGSFGGSTYGGSSGSDNWSGSSSLIGSGLSANSQTMIGRAMGDLSALGGFGGGVGTIGGTAYGSSPAGYGANGAFSPGSIGLSGIATRDGLSGFHQTGALGFGNFGNAGLGDAEGPLGGINPATLGRQGLTQGNPDTMSWLGGFSGYDGYSGPGAMIGLGYGANQTLDGSNIGKSSYSPFGGLNGVESSNMGFGTPVAAAASPGVLSGVPSAGALAAAPAVSVSDTAMQGLGAAAPMGLRAYGLQNAESSQEATDTPTPSGFGSFGSLDGVNFDAPSIQEQANQLPTGYNRLALLGAVNSEGDVDLNHDFANVISPAKRVARVGAASEPGFDNFGLSGIGTQTASFAGGDYTPPNWSPAGAMADMVQNYQDYDSGGKYPGLTIHPTLNGAFGLLGNFSQESGGVRTGLGNLDAQGLEGGVGPGLGLAQWTSKDRKDAFKQAMGIPAGASDREAAAMLEGTTREQIGFALNEIQNKYPTVAATMQSPVSLGTVVNSVGGDYENPRDLSSSIGVRQAAAQALADQYAAGIAQGYQPPQTRPAPQTVFVDPMAAFSPGAASGADGLMSLGGWTSGAYSGDDSTPSDQLRTGWDAETQGSEPGVYQQGLADSARLAAQILGGRVSSSDASPSNLTVGVPTRTADGVTPSYLPGQKAAIKTGLNVAAGAIPGVGVVNTLSGLLGGPTVGSLVTDYSQPGSATLIDGGRSGGERQTYGQSTPYGDVLGSSSIPSVIQSSASATSLAQHAYLEALKHLPGPGATAVKANAVPLAPPDASGAAGFYNPMNDPAVRAALR